MLTIQLACSHPCWMEAGLQLTNLMFCYSFGTDHTENFIFHGSTIVAYVSIATNTCLLSSYLAADDFLAIKSQYVNFVHFIQRMHKKSIRTCLVAVLLRTVWNYCVLCSHTYCVIHPCHRICLWPANSRCGCYYLKAHFPLKQRNFYLKYCLGFR